MINDTDRWRPVKIWAPLLLGIFGYVVAVDVRSKQTNKEMMTTEFREGLSHQVLGPVLFGVWNGIFAGLNYHFQFNPTYKKKRASDG